MCHFVSWYQRNAKTLKGEPTILFVTDVEIDANPSLAKQEWMDRCGHGFAASIFNRQLSQARKTMREFYQCEIDLYTNGPDKIPAIIKDAILKGKMTKVGMELQMLNPATRKEYRALVKESKKAADKAERSKGHYDSKDDRRIHYEFCLKTFWKLFKKPSNRAAVWQKKATTK
jgi:hypothetical protein